MRRYLSENLNTFGRNHMKCFNLKKPLFIPTELETYLSTEIGKKRQCDIFNTVKSVL